MQQIGMLCLAISMPTIATLVMLRFFKQRESRHEDDISMGR